jgi:hypothetical protein
MTTKQKVLILIPLLIITGMLVYCWAIILATDIIATWRHYTGLILFCLLIFLFYRSKKIIIATGVYLLLATCNLLVITPAIYTYHITIGISLPPFQHVSLGLLVLYLILNNETIIDNYLDYKESKHLKIPDQKK